MKDDIAAMAVCFNDLNIERSNFNSNQPATKRARRLSVPTAMFFRDCCRFIVYA
jgi:hypothetical protein